MAFDGLLVISGSQVQSSAAAAAAAAATLAEASDDVDCVAMTALSAYCKGPSATSAAAAASGALPASRLIAHLARSMTTTTTASKNYQRNYQPRFCIRGRNVVNAKVSPLRRSLDDAYCLALASPSPGGGGGAHGWPQRGEPCALIKVAAAVAATTATTSRTGEEAPLPAPPLNLPAISLEGPGFSHRLRSRSYYLAGDLTAAELEGMTVAAAAAAADAAENRVFTGLAWAEPDEACDGSSQTTATTTTAATTAVAARKRAKKKPVERISPLSSSSSVKSDVSELRIEVKKNKIAAAASAATRASAAVLPTTTEKAATVVKRTDVDRLPFDSIDSYLALGRRERRPQHPGNGALYHSTASISCRKLSRGGDLDGDRMDMLIQVKPVRGT